MAKQTKPTLRTGDRVTLANHVRTPVRDALQGRPDILRDTVLDVVSILGHGTARAPWLVVVGMDGVQRGMFEPGDLVVV